MDDWEALYEPEVKEKKKVSPPSSSPSTAKKTDQIAGKRVSTLVGEDDSTPLDDPVKERKRREDLIKQQEAQLFGDLLDGCEPSADAGVPEIAVSKPKLAHILSVTASEAKRVDTNQLKSFTDCNRFVETLAPTIAKSNAKSPAWLALMNGLLNHVLPKMTEVDIQTFQNRLEKMAAEQVKSKKLASQSKVKIYAKNKYQVKNYKDEYDMFYGKDRDSDDYDEGEDNDEEAYYAAGTGGGNQEDTSEKVAEKSGAAVGGNDLDPDKKDKADTGHDKTYRVDADHDDDFM